MKSFIGILLLFFSLAGYAKSGSDPQEVFFEAIRKGEARVIKEAIDNGYPLNSANESGHTPICWAVLYGQLEIVKMLVEAGANPNTGKNPALTCGTATKHKSKGDIVEYLISKDADINLARHDGLTPLLLAVMHGTDELVELIVLKGADVNYVSGSGKTALDWAEFQKRDALVSFLKTHGASNGYGPRLGNRNPANDFTYFFIYAFHPSAIVVFFAAFWIKRRSGLNLSPLALSYSVPVAMFFFINLPNIYFKTMFIPLLIESSAALISLAFQAIAYKKNSSVSFTLSKAFAFFGFLSVTPYYLLLIASLSSTS